LPNPPDLLALTVPLEAHETSYFADSARTLSFSNTASFISHKGTDFLRKTTPRIAKILRIVDNFSEKLCRIIYFT